MHICYQKYCFELYVHSEKITKLLTVTMRRFKKYSLKQILCLNHKHRQLDCATMLSYTLTLRA